MFTGNDLPGLGGLFAFLIGVGIVIGVVGYWLVLWVMSHITITANWN